MTEVNSLMLDLMDKKEKENELTVKEPHLPKMRPEDRHTLSFLRGVVQIKEKNNETAFADIESTAWNHTSSNISEDSILGACLRIIVDEETKLYSFKSLKDVLFSGSKHFLFSSSQKQSNGSDRSIGLLFPFDSELTPPFEDNWPSLSVVGHNSRCHKKYEEKLSSNSTKKRSGIGHRLPGPILMNIIFSWITQLKELCVICMQICGYHPSSKAHKMIPELSLH